MGICCCKLLIRLRPVPITLYYYYFALFKIESVVYYISQSSEVNELLLLVIVVVYYTQQLIAVLFTKSVNRSTRTLLYATGRTPLTLRLGRRRRLVPVVVEHKTKPQRVHMNENIQWQGIRVQRSQSGPRDC